MLNYEPYSILWLHCLFVQLFLFPGVNNCHGFFYLLGFSVIIFLCVLWWIWQMALNVNVPNAQILKTFITSICFFLSVLWLLSWSSLVCQFFRPATKLLSWNSSLSFSLLGIDCFEEFPVLWVLVGGKASLSHLKLKMSDAQFSSPSYSQSSGTGINLSESDEPSIYLEPETWRDEDLEELFGSMIVAAKWLHSWLHHPGLFRVNGVSTYPH